MEVSCFYAVADATAKLEEVYIDYDIQNEIELFELYTKYQNHFPLGYSSPANPNITLLKSDVQKNQVFYEVDNFIFLSDIPLFQQALLFTGKALGYEEIHIFFNEKQLI